MKTKKYRVFSLLLTIAMVMTMILMMGSVAFAEDTDYDEPVRVGDWEYILNGEDSDTVSISGYYGSETEITIPSELDGYVVTGIKDWAFSRTINKTIKKMTLPDSITELGYGPFNDCTGLESVTLSDNITTLPYHLFGNCANLKEVHMPAKLESIEESVFDSCTSLEELTIPKTVTKIGIRAFYGCTGLTSLIIPHSVTEVENEAFAGCENLTLYGLPDSVIQDYANTNSIPFVLYFDAEDELILGESIDVDIESGTMYYSFTPGEDGTYIISAGGECDTYGYLYSSDGELLAYNDDANNSRNFAIEYEMKAGRTYIVGAKQWEGQSAQFTLSVIKARVSIAVPKAVTGLVYRGSTLTGVAAGTGYTLTGNTAKNAGTYKAIATLEENYEWSDGTTEPKEITFTIKKATPKVTVSGTTKTVKYKTVKKKAAYTSAVAVTGAKGTKSFYKAGGSSKLTISKTTGKIKVKKGTKKGTYSIKVKVISAATKNYNAKTSSVKTIKVRVK